MAHKYILHMDCAGDGDYVCLNVFFFFFALNFFK